jgi:hypothetical protein
MDREAPRWKKSKTDTVEPRRAMPNIESVEPKRPKLLRDKELPT